jgi:tetratricopeptide (TPR) repeat protein
MQKFKRSDKTPQEIAHELDVGYLLAGTVRWVRDSAHSRIQVRPELLRVDDGTTRWQETYDEPLGDLFRVQAEIAHQAAAEIITTLGSGSNTPVTATVPKVLPTTDSYLRYLRGLSELNRGTRESLLKAEQFFTQAIELDSTFGEAYAGLADALNFQDVRPLRVLDRMRAAARRGVELAPQSPVTHTALGGVQLWFDWSFAAAERSLRRALSIDPNYARAYHYLTYLLRDLGRIDEAMVIAREARLRDPLSDDAARVQFIPLYESRRYEDVITLARRELAVDSSNLAAIEFLGGALVHSGRTAQGLSILRQAVARQPSCGMTRMLGVAWAIAGEEDSARAIIDSWRRKPPCEALEAFFAAVYASLGEADSAFTWLERGYTARVPHMADLRVVQHFRSLRGDPRYDELLRRVGLPPQ